MNQYEREEAQLEQDLREGRISQADYNKESREMERSYRDEMRERAEQAYDDVMNGY